MLDTLMLIKPCNLLNKNFTIFVIFESKILQVCKSKENFEHCSQYNIQIKISFQFVG